MRLQGSIIACISSVSLGFMPAVGSSSMRTRAQSEGARELEAAPIGVGKAMGRAIETRGQPLAEEGEDLARFIPQRGFLALDRAGADRPERELGERADQRDGRSHRAKTRVSAEKHIVFDTEVGEHSAVLKRARSQALRSLPAGGVGSAGLQREFRPRRTGRDRSPC